MSGLPIKYTIGFSPHAVVAGGLMSGSRFRRAVCLEGQATSRYAGKTGSVAKVRKKLIHISLHLELIA